MLHPLLALERRAACDTLSRSARKLTQLLPRIEADEDSALLYKFRVQLRRVHALSRTLEGVAPVADIAGLAEECRWLACVSGALRDSDLVLQSLPAHLAAIAAGNTVAARKICTLLRARRKREHRELRLVLKSPRGRDLCARLQALAMLSPHTPGWVAKPLARAASSVALRRVLKQGRALARQPSAEAMHDLRKRCKRLHYLLDSFAPVLSGGKTEDLLRQVKGLQELLGEHQDAVIQLEMLEALRASVPQAPAARHAFLGLIDSLKSRITGRQADVASRCVEGFASLARHRPDYQGLLQPDPLLRRPFFGTHGYCHGTLDGQYIDLPVGKIVCVGRNYAAHAAELGNPVPETPLLFIKPPSAAVDFAPSIHIPVGRGEVHHELEIAVLIGDELHAANARQARAAIAGIGLAIDITLREMQDGLKKKGQPWELAKGFDGAAPLSPFVALGRHTDLTALELRLSVNGRRRQAGSSAEMLNPIIALICHISARFSLWPGDVVLTGTPKGVGPLRPGDRLSAELPGLLRVRSQVC